MKMEVDVSRITHLLQGLSATEAHNVTSRLQSLIDIKALVVSRPVSNLKNLIHATDLAHLFNCLNTLNREEVEVTCFILHTLLPIVDPVDVMSGLSSSLHYGLNHSSKTVQNLVIKELIRVIATVEGVNALGQSPELIKQIIMMVGEEDEALAISAVNLLSNFGRASTRVTSCLLDKSHPCPLLPSLKQVMQTNDIVRFRVYEVVCSIAAESTEMLDICVQSDILGQFCNEFNGDDFLLKVTCVSMLADLASAPHAMDYLVEVGVVAQLINMIKLAPSDPMSSLYLPGVVRFFGNVGVYKGGAYVSELYPGFVPDLLHMLHADDIAIKRIALQTVAVMAEPGEGKLLLHQRGGEGMTSGVKEIARLMSSGATEVKILACGTMHNLISHSRVSGDEERGDVEKLTAAWFALISSDPLSTVINMCKQPFPDIKCAALRLLGAVASSDWGLRAMAGRATLAEYLTDRSTESADARCREAKYEAVTRVVERGAACAQLFGNRHYLRFRQFVNEGAHMVESAPAVATGEA